MTEYETHAAFVESLEAEVSRLLAINAELRARESTSLRQRADAWMAVCALLRELRPSWQEGPGSAQEQALEAIRAMAAQTTTEQEPFGYFRAEPFGWADCSPDAEGAVPLYAAPQPARQPLTDEEICAIFIRLDPLFWDAPTGFELDFARAIERAIQRAHGIGGESC